MGINEGGVRVYWIGFSRFCFESDSEPLVMSGPLALLPLKYYVPYIVQVVTHKQQYFWRYGSSDLFRDYRLYEVLRYVL